MTTRPKCGLYLMPFYGRQLFFQTLVQKTMAVRTDFRPIFYDLIHFLGGNELPMVSLMSRLPPWRSPTFFSLGSLWSLRRILRWRLRRIAGIPIQPGLQLIDPLLHWAISSKYCCRASSNTRM